MKDLLLEFYSINAIGIIKLSKKCYKIKTSQNSFILKIADDENVQTIYNYITMLKLNFIVKPLLNKNGLVLTKYQDKWIYITPYLEQDGINVKGLKLRVYFEKIAQLHNKSFYSEKISNGYFEKLFEYLQDQIVSRRSFFENMIQKIESSNYKSSSEWLFLLNYNKIMASINKSDDFLRKVMKQTESKSSIRLSLVYNNFDYDHILLEKDMLLSIDKMKIDLPIFDIYDVYQRMDDVFFDLDDLISNYLKKVILYDYEKSLLCCLLLLVPVIDMNEDEIENVITLTRLFYYLNAVQTVIDLLQAK